MFTTRSCEPRCISTKRRFNGGSNNFRSVTTSGHRTRRLRESETTDGTEVAVEPAVQAACAPMRQEEERRTREVPSSRRVLKDKSRAFDLMLAARPSSAGGLSSAGHLLGVGRLPGLERPSTMDEIDHPALLNALRIQPLGRPITSHLSYCRPPPASPSSAVPAHASVPAAAAGTCACHRKMRARTTRAWA